MGKLKSYDKVIGHKSIIKWLMNSVEKDILPNIVMLSGPPGIGKTTLAKITACEIACKMHPEKLEITKNAVIEKNQSCDCVKVYNMSNLKSQEAVLEVKADLSVGFSSTGRKVIIMDEAHGMSNDAQDFLLTSFESLEDNVYVIICTTELTNFREAFLSRCILRRLSSLTRSEMITLIKNTIAERCLSFSISNTMAINLIVTYTGRDPRRAVNLLNSFEENTTVQAQDLEAFFSVYEGKQVFRLIKYMYYGSILNGLDFISDMEISSTFGDTLLELLRVAQGAQSFIIDRDAIVDLRSIMTEYGLGTLIGFTVDCTTRRLTRTSLSGYFLKWCKSDIKDMKPVKQTEEEVRVNDLAVMSHMIDNVTIESSGGPNVPTLENLFENAEVIE